MIVVRQIWIFRFPLFYFLFASVVKTHTKKKEIISHLLQHSHLLHTVYRLGRSNDDTFVTPQWYFSTYVKYDVSYLTLHVT